MQDAHNQPVADKFLQHSEYKVERLPLAWLDRNKAQLHEQDRLMRSKENRDRYLRNKERCKTDTSYRVLLRLRSRLSRALRDQTARKQGRTVGLLGCSVEQLRKHLESQFKPGMTWENYGYRGWHIDHKRPCIAFDLSRRSEQRACFHWTNLQPLWARENFAKQGYEFRK